MVFADPAKLKGHVLESHMTQQTGPVLIKHDRCPWSACSYHVPAAMKIEAATTSAAAEPVQDCISKNNVSLFDHIMEAHVQWTETPERVIVCHWGHCGRFFADKTKFAEHIKSHAGIKNVLCTEGCGKAFTNESQMRTHIKRSHTEGFSCPDCDKQYTTAFNLREHQKVVHQGNGYICPKCARQYKSSKSFQVHKRRCGSVQQVIEVQHNENIDALPH